MANLELIKNELQGIDADLLAELEGFENLDKTEKKSFSYLKADTDGFSLEINKEIIFKDKKDLNVVVFFDHNNQVYTENNGKEQTLICSSPDAITGKNRLTGEILNCATCPNNKFTGNTPPVCKLKRRLYLLVEGVKDPVCLSLPSKSRAVWRDYKTTLKNVPYILYKAIISTEKVEEGSFKFWRLTVKKGEKLDNATLKTAMELRKISQNYLSSEPLELEEENINNYNRDKTFDIEAEEKTTLNPVNPDNSRFFNKVCEIDPDPKYKYGDTAAELLENKYKVANPDQLDVNLHEEFLKELTEKMNTKTPF